MLDLHTTDAFATWFSALPAAPAEDVAATLEVIVQLGTRTEAPGSSEMLLWYEHPMLSQGQQRVPGLLDPRPVPPQFVKFTQDWGQLLEYTKRVLQHLESKAFVARLGSLSESDAAAVAEGVKRIRRLTTTRGLAMSEYQTRHMRRHLHSPTASSTEALARLTDAADLREAYFAVLTAAGFEIADVQRHTAALREISL